MSGRRPSGQVSPAVAKLRQRIAERRVSGYRLAKLTGLPLSTVQQFIAGASSPTMSTMDAIAAAVGMRIAAIDDE